MRPNFAMVFTISVQQLTAAEKCKRRNEQENPSAGLAAWELESECAHENRSMPLEIKDGEAEQQRAPALCGSVPCMQHRRHVGQTPFYKMPITWTPLAVRHGAEGEQAHPAMRELT